MDVDAEREKISQEIQALERMLGFDEEASESSLGSDSGSDSDSLTHEDSASAGPPSSEEERWDGASNDEDPRGKPLPEDPETCLQLNMVYQLVLQEKLAEVRLLLAQNREQQEEVMWDLAGSKGPRAKDGKSLPMNLYIGHFLKPYFKDKVTGVGPPANEDAREKAGQGIKTFEELLVAKWKSWEKALLRKAVVSDRLQRLLQPKLLKLEYLQQKLSKATSEEERQALEKQIGKAEREIRDINQLPEEALLGSRLDSHDWEKISNINFEGSRSAEEIRKFWQNWEHPSINKQEWTRPELDQLKAVAAKHGHLHWQQIAEELGTRRSAFQCLQQFQQHNKDLKRRAWTEAEDRMLTQLVQEMRVGNHIPYRRIVYYMEGRDSVQLIYRWTKNLDPRLRKGLWTPEEDTKLLQAVAKYGEHDWCKVREEVPGRSDTQCRERYIRRLHFSVRKGRWSPSEEERLLELIEKHGVGRWEKIASELPHRTGPQCLSKWKIIVRRRSRGRQQRRRRRRRHLRSVRWSSSSEASGGGDSSSEDSRDSESEPESEPEAEPEPARGPQEGGRSRPPAQHTVPDVDLWVPARQGAHALGPGGCPGGAAPSPSGPRAPSAAPGGSRDAAEAGRRAPSGTHGASRGSIGAPPCTDTHPRSSEGPADEGARQPLKVPLETLRCMLKTNMADRGRALKPCLFGSAQGNTPGGSVVARPHVGQLWRQHRRHALQQKRLGRRLLMAISPWVGDITVPCAPRRRPAAPTRADSIGAQLQDARLASTPVFTLFMQLFHIDTAGCMEVIGERSARPPALPQPAAQAPSSAQSTPGHLPGQVTARGAAARRPRGAGRRGPQACPPRAASPAPPPHKVKTVFQLLREKRLREAQASRAAAGPVVLPPQLLLSSPVILQPPLALAAHGPPATAPGVSESTPPGPGAPAAAGPSTPGPGVSTPSTRPLALQALALAPVSTVALQVPVSRQLDSLGPSQAPAFLPTAPSPAQPLLQPLGLMPAPGTPEGGPHVVASTPLPASSVLTAPGLLPVPLPAVVGLPGPAATPDPQVLAATLLPSLTETPAGQGPASQEGEPGPASRADLGSLRPAPPPQVPAEALPLPPGAGPGRTPLSPVGAPGSERPPPALRGPEKDAPDLSLLSQESEPAVLEWLRGQRGVCVPPLGSRLPYQPPALCSLRALSGLLLHKKTLERTAAALLPGRTDDTLQAARRRVREQLRDSPAYLLLKARFLAAFTLPALLATLAPPGVRTTLSATRPASGSEDEELEDLARSDGGGQPGQASGSAQAGPAATTPVQGAPEPGQGPAPSCPDDLDDLDVLRTRRGRHARKRKRLL